MTAPTAPRRTGRVLGLVAVVTGAMVLSYRGQVSAVDPLLGPGLGSVLALTLDAATLLALHEVLVSGRGSSIRRWAWATLLFAGGISLGLNTWHALAAGNLPVPAGVAVGAGPVVLAGLVSHLLALSVGGTSESVPAGPTGTSPVGTSRSVPVVPAPPVGTSAGTAPVGTGGTARLPGTGLVPVAPVGTRPAPVPAAGTTRPDSTGTSSAPVPAAPVGTAGKSPAPTRPSRPTRPAPGPSSRDELPPAARALWGRARELDVAHRAANGGTGMSRRALMDELGCGTSTAAALRSALESAAGTTAGPTGTSAGTAHPAGTAGTSDRPGGTGPTGTSPAPVPAAGTGDESTTTGTGTGPSPAPTGTSAALRALSLVPDSAPDR